jgi:hypothetical protein
MSYDESDGSDPSSARSTISSRIEIGPDLAQVIDSWPTLPESLRAGILAMIGSVRK